MIGEIRIGTISEASVMNLGNNHVSHFTNNKKQNQGFGSITGDHNTIEDIRSLLNDPDFIDLFSEVEGGNIPKWLKEIFEKEHQMEEEEQSLSTDSTNKTTD